MKFKEAVSFFSRLPVGDIPLPNDFKGFFIWFPFVGLIIGAVVAFITGIFAVLIPSFLCGVIGALAWVLLTGGIHLTGVADSADALFCCCRRSNRLEVLYGPRIGTSATISVFFVLAVKTVALTMLAAHYDIANSYDALVHFMFICMGAAGFARCVAFLATKWPLSKNQGLVEKFAKPLLDFDYAIVALLAFIICYFSGVHSAFMIIASAIFTLIMLKIANKRLGGYTSDVLGCITEGVEALVLVSFCLSL